MNDPYQNWSIDSQQKFLDQFYSPEAVQMQDIALWGDLAGTEGQKVAVLLSNIEQMHEENVKEEYLIYWRSEMMKTLDARMGERDGDFFVDFGNALNRIKDFESSSPIESREDERILKCYRALKQELQRTPTRPELRDLVNQIYYQYHLHEKMDSGSFSKCLKRLGMGELAR